jgi:hypothetical protein
VRRAVKMLACSTREAGRRQECVHKWCRSWSFWNVPVTGETEGKRPPEGGRAAAAVRRQPRHEAKMENGRAGDGETVI